MNLLRSASYDEILFLKCVTAYVRRCQLYLTTKANRLQMLCPVSRKLATSHHIGLPMLYMHRFCHRYIRLSA